MFHRMIYSHLIKWFPLDMKMGKVRRKRRTAVKTDSSDLSDVPEKTWMGKQWNVKFAPRVGVECALYYITRLLKPYSAWMNDWMVDWIVEWLKMRSNKSLLATCMRPIEAILDEFIIIPPASMQTLTTYYTLVPSPKYRNRHMWGLKKEARERQSE